MGKSRRNKKPFDPTSIFILKSTQNDFKWVPNIGRKSDSKHEPVGFFHVYQFKCDCNDPWYCEWESADIYAAKGEYEYCENPKCSEKPPLKPYNKEPILSPTPCYSAEGSFHGSFQCPNPNCKYAWNSALAYADTYQECRRCETWAYSFNMTDQPLFTSSKGHIQASCGMCKNKEHPCFYEEVEGRGNWNRYFSNPNPVNNDKPKKKKNGKKASNGGNGMININQNNGGGGGSDDGPSGIPVPVPKKKKRNRSGKKQKVEAAPIKAISPPRKTEGNIVKIVQDLSKMSFSNAPKME